MKELLTTLREWESQPRWGPLAAGDATNRLYARLPERLMERTEHCLGPTCRLRLGDYRRHNTALGKFVMRVTRFGALAVVFIAAALIGVMTAPRRSAAEAHHQSAAR